MLDLLMDSNKHNKGIVTESLKLLKTLAGNDNVKKEIGESNGIHIIISAINNYVVRKSRFEYVESRFWTIVNNIQ